MSSEWSTLNREWPRAALPPPARPVARPYDPAGRCAPCDPYQSFYQEEQQIQEICQQQPQMPPSCQQMELCYPLQETQAFSYQFQQLPPPPMMPTQSYFGQMPHTKVPSPPQPLSPTFPGPLDQAVPRGDNPREIRNKAEKQRRDKLNRSISELAGLVPPVVAASRKIDKTGVLRLTAHYLRAHQYVFGDSIGQSEPDITSDSAAALLRLLHGFLLTVTYKGLVVVVSQNVHEFLGYTELDLLGQNIMMIVHEEDRRMLQEQLAPRSGLLGPSGELLVPDDLDAAKEVNDSLGKERRTFNVRFKKLTQRSEPARYVTCQVEGSLRKADRACRGYTRCCQMVRRARARGDNPCSSGNDVVFVGIARPSIETFITEREIESFRMEYSTRHLVDGEIIQCEQKISLVTGYMTHEVRGVNAMTFMHRDDVRWVIIALREMYDRRRLFGESCYRLMTKNGQFIYMKTRGRLEVDQSSQEVTTFVCINTVVDETEGKHLISQMKKKFMMVVNNNQDPMIEEETSSNDNRKVSVEDPRQLEKVIMHLVTDLSPPDSGGDSTRSCTPDDGTPRLTIIPPRRERIVSSIDKMYKVFNDFDSRPREDKKTERKTVLKNIEPIIVSASVPKHDTFEEHFLKVTEGDEPVSFMPKVSDQVLAAVQLEDEEPSIAAKRRRADADRSPKRKLSAQHCELKISDDLFENGQEVLLDDAGLDSQLDSALNLFSAAGNGGEASNAFPDILLGTEFQELFSSIEAAPADDQISNKPSD